MKHSQLAFMAPYIRQQSTVFATRCSNRRPSAFPVDASTVENAACRPTILTRCAGSLDGSVGMSTAGEQPSGVYEAVLPQTETLVGMGFILVLCVALYWVWENQVVPVSRTKLAISKSRGELKEYLDELKESSVTSDSVSQSSSPNLMSSEISSEADSVDVPTLQTATLASDDEGKITETRSTSSKPSPTRDRAFERWLFTDWLIDNKSERKAGRQKEPALPILKDAKWNSGDNPVVVASFLMLVGIVVTSLTERIASFG